MPRMPNPPGTRIPSIFEEHLLDLFGREGLRIHPVDVDLVVVVDAGMVESLVDREVGVGKLHVLAHERDIDLGRERCRVGDELVPLGHVGLGALEREPIDDHLVEPLLVRV